MWRAGGRAGGAAGRKTGRDATSMATGVHTALLRVLEPRLGAAGAAEQLQRMSDERRYVRDVWS